MIPETLLFCYSYSIYSILHEIAHCKPLHLLPSKHNLYYAITNFTIGVYLAGTTPVSPPPISKLHVVSEHVFPQRYLRPHYSIKKVSGFRLFTRACGASVGARAKSHTNIAHQQSCMEVVSRGVLVFLLLHPFLFNCLLRF